MRFSIAVFKVLFGCEPGFSNPVQLKLVKKIAKEKRPAKLIPVESTLAIQSAPELMRKTCGFGWAPPARQPLRVRAK